MASTFPWTKIHPTLFQTPIVTITDPNNIAKTSDTQLRVVNVKTNEILRELKNTKKEFTE